MYPQYLPLYNQRYAVPSPLTINMTGSNVGANYTIQLVINKVATITATNLRAQLVLTESGISYAWQGQTVINNTERLMVPDASGTAISFTSGNTVTLTLTFTLDASWVLNNCELIAFVQDNGTKEILNGTKKMLNALYLPLATDFSGTPTTGCSPLTVNYTDLSAGATAWNWSFPGGTPSTSTVKNPTVVYNTAGAYDVTLVASNPGANQQGTMTKPAYINPTTVPAAPSMPNGETGMCINPPNQVYTINTVPNCTGYTWDLSPAGAGLLTPNGTSCTIDWNNTFTGGAQLKALALNACGNGIWSSPLVINISDIPGAATTPTGPASLCINSPNTVYTTTGSAPATNYIWELMPADAGALYPNMTSVTIDWLNTFTGSCTLRVKPVNGSCEGQWTNYLNITIETGPNAYNMTGGGAYCGQGGNGSPIGLDGSQTNTNYTLWLNGVATTTVVPGTGSAISFGNQMQAGSYTAVAHTSGAGCPNTMNGTIPVTIDPQVPNVPGDPMGPAQVYTGSTPTTDFTTTGGTYSTTYTWELSPTNAGTFSGNTTTGTVTWNQTYSGTANIRVKGVNSCGGGSFSNDFPVTVDVGVGIGETNQPKLISIFPNPASGTITIIPARPISADIQVYNSLGSVAMNKTGISLNGKYQMDISGLQAGIYFIHVSSSTGTQILKMIVE